jgi:hypothetical protein
VHDGHILLVEIEGRKRRAVGILVVVRCLLSFGLF